MILRGFALSSLCFLAFAAQVVKGPSGEPTPLETSQEVLGTALLPKLADPLPPVATAADETALILAADQGREAIPTGELFFLGEQQTSGAAPQAFRIPPEVVRMVLSWAE
jgi:hypothetical protein